MLQVTGRPSQVHDLPPRSHTVGSPHSRWREAHERLKDSHFETHHQQHVTLGCWPGDSPSVELRTAFVCLRFHPHSLIPRCPANFLIGPFFPPSGNYMCLSSPGIQSGSDQILIIKMRLKYFRLTFFFLLTTYTERITQSFIHSAQDRLRCAQGKRIDVSTTVCVRLYIYKWKWKSLSRVQLFDPMDRIVHGILQARILEWVAFPFSTWSS